MPKNDGYLNAKNCVLWNGPLDVVTGAVVFGYRGAHSALVLAVGNENRPARQFYQKELSKKNHEQMRQHTVVAVVVVVVVEVFI